MYSFEYQEIIQEVNKQKQFNWILLVALSFLLATCLLGVSYIYRIKQEHEQEMALKKMQHEQYKKQQEWWLANQKDYTEAFIREQKKKGIYNGSTKTGQRVDRTRNETDHSQSSRGVGRKIE